jgi:hypothetical protein
LPRTGAHFSRAKRGAGAFAPDALARAVLRVGDGRGFVVERRVDLGVEPIIITAAHCLPRLPPPYEHLLALPAPHLARYLGEETYERLLGPSGAEPTVWATCLFVDPIADIAVLGQPDNQALSRQADAYDRLVKAMEPMAVADAPAQGVELVPGGAAARVLSLGGEWIEGRVLRRGGWLKFQPPETFVSGMSGSPIINTAGAAIGVVSVDHMSPVIVDSLSTQIMRAISTHATPYERDASQRETGHHRAHSAST